MSKASLSFGLLVLAVVALFCTCAGTAGAGPLACQAGTYSESGFEPCAPASLGHFVPGEGETFERACMPGTYAGVTGLADCSPARPGHYVITTGAFADVPCEPGHFAEKAESFMCLPAPMGTWAGEGAVVPVPCSAGTYSPNLEGTSPAACIQADPGFYVDQVAATTQTLCPLGTGSSVPGATCCIATPSSLPVGLPVVPAGAAAQPLAKPPPLRCKKGFKKTKVKGKQRCVRSKKHRR